MRCSSSPGHLQSCDSYDAPPMMRSSVQALGMVHAPLAVGNHVLKLDVKTPNRSLGILLNTTTRGNHRSSNSGSLTPWSIRTTRVVNLDTLMRAGCPDPKLVSQTTQEPLCTSVACHTIRMRRTEFSLLLLAFRECPSSPTESSVSSSS